MAGGGVDPDVLRNVQARCAEMFQGNWREGQRGDVPYAYTSPSPGRYPWQWYWDSWLIAIAKRHVDPAQAGLELNTLLSAMQYDGLIGHTIFWGEPISRTRRLFYTVHSRHDLMTKTIQPPGLAYAIKVTGGDPLADPRVGVHQDYFARERDLEGDGLIWLIQPDESGLDASPQFDPVWGKEAQGKPGFLRLVHANRKFAFDAHRIADAGRPVVCEPLTNTIYGLSQLAMGRPSITQALIDRCWNPDLGLFVLDARPQLLETPPITIASLAPLALPDLPAAIGREMIDRHVLNSDEFWTPYAPSSVAKNEPTFSMKDTELGLRRYWRGPTWLNTAWLIWLGMVRLGYDAEAGELTSKLAELVAREGLREYYNSFTGEGMGAEEFGWTALILDMAADLPGARTSYLWTPPGAGPPSPGVSASL